MFARYFKIDTPESEEVLFDYASRYIASLEKTGTAPADERFLPGQTGDNIRKNVCRLYDRFCESGMYGEKCRLSLSIYDILSAGKSIFGKYRCRVEYRADGLKDSPGSFISFAPFSFVLSELMIMMIGISADRSALIETNDRAEYIETVIKCFPRKTAERADGDDVFEYLRRNYPAERDNLDAVRYIAGRQNWSVSVENDESGGTVSTVLKIYDRSDGGERVFAPNGLAAEQFARSKKSTAELMIDTFIGLINKN